MVLLCCLNVNINSSIAPITFIIFGDYLPDPGMGIIGVVFSLFNAILAFSFPILISVYGDGGVTMTFFIFGVIQFICFYVCKKVFIESRNKTQN